MYNGNLVYHDFDYNIYTQSKEHKLEMWHFWEASKQSKTFIDLAQLSPLSTFHAINKNGEGK